MVALILRLLATIHEARMDRWHEIVAGSNVWYSVRELYDVVVLCVSNRGVDDVQVEVDYRGSSNANVFGRLPSSQVATAADGANRFSDLGTIRIAVPGCTTRACLTFYAIDPQMPPKLRVVCSLVTRPQQLGYDAGAQGIDTGPSDGPHFSVDDTAQQQVYNDGTTAEVERQSKHVETWLAGRNRYRGTSPPPRR